MPWRDAVMLITAGKPRVFQTVYEGDLIRSGLIEKGYEGVRFWDAGRHQPTQKHHGVGGVVLRNMKDLLSPMTSEKRV